MVAHANEGHGDAELSMSGAKRALFFLRWQGEIPEPSERGGSGSHSEPSTLEPTYPEALRAQSERLAQEKERVKKALEIYGPKEKREWSMAEWDAWHRRMALLHSRSHAYRKRRVTECPVCHTAVLVRRLNEHLKEEHAPDADADHK